MKKILAATNNVGKLKEIKEILKDFEILSLKDINRIYGERVFSRFMGGFKMCQFIGRDLR